MSTFVKWFFASMTQGLCNTARSIADVGADGLNTFLRNPSHGKPNRLIGFVKHPLKGRKK